LNLTWYIQVADSQENYIDKSGQASKTTGAIFHQSDDSVQAFGFCVSNKFTGKGQNPMEMFSKPID